MTASAKKHVTILFLRREGEVLLAMKKIGFGSGKWNGTGGKLESDETALQAAVRECQEEIGVTPLAPQKVGEIDFRLGGNIASASHMHNNYAHVYVATAWQGEPHETDEMRPQWFAEDAIPYDQMWPDDRLWLPLILAGKRFRASFTLDENETIVHSEVIELTEGEDFA